MLKKCVVNAKEGSLWKETNTPMRQSGNIASMKRDRNEQHMAVLTKERKALKAKKRNIQGDAKVIEIVRLMKQDMGFGKKMEEKIIVGVMIWVDKKRREKNNRKKIQTTLLSR